MFAGLNAFCKCLGFNLCVDAQRNYRRSRRFRLLPRNGLGRLTELPMHSGGKRQTANACDRARREERRSARVRWNNCGLHYFNSPRESLAVKRFGAKEHSLDGSSFFTVERPSRFLPEFSVTCLRASREPLKPYHDVSDSRARVEPANRYNKRGVLWCGIAQR